MEVDISRDVVDDSYCAVCGELFLARVVLSCVDCYRCFCNCCREQFWVERGVKECPLCFKWSPGHPHRTCKAHKERLRLLCVDDLDPVCFTCHRSGLHINHRVFLIKEAFNDHKMEDDISSHVVDDSYCAVCRKLFLAPVVLACVDCYRCFCTSCLEQFWKQHGVKECPLCPKESPGLPHRTCKAHEERLLLLCIADLDPVCSTCHRSGLHINHKVFPIKEAFNDHKPKLKKKCWTWQIRPGKPVQSCSEKHITEETSVSQLRTPCCSLWAQSTVHCS